MPWYLEGGIDPLFAQVIYALAVKLETVQASLAKGECDVDDPGVEFGWLTAADLVERDGLEQFLLQYVTNNVDSFEAECEDWNFSMPTDKGNVNGQSLQVSVTVTPTNFAFLTTPVALLQCR